jgi:hypothetical protein
MTLGASPNQVPCTHLTEVLIESSPSSPLRPGSSFRPWLESQHAGRDVLCRNRSALDQRRLGCRRHLGERGPDELIFACHPGIGGLPRGLRVGSIRARSCVLPNVKLCSNAARSASPRCSARWRGARYRADPSRASSDTHVASCTRGASRQCGLDWIEPQDRRGNLREGEKVVVLHRGEADEPVDTSAARATRPAQM